MWFLLVNIVPYSSLFVWFYDTAHIFFSICVVLSFLVFWLPLRKIKGLPGVMLAFVWLSYVLNAATFALLLYLDIWFPDIEKTFHNVSFIVDTVAFFVSLLTYHFMDIIHEDDDNDENIEKPKTYRCI